jgi:hypothetical protein
MKTLSLLTLVGVVLTATALNVPANDALLTPRAKGNEIKVDPGTMTGRNLATDNRNLTATPRSLDNQAKAVVPAEARNLAVGACAVGSPRQVESPGKMASASCCQPVPSVCPVLKACCTGR